VGGLAAIKDDLYGNVILPLRYHKAYFHPLLPSLHVAKGILLTGPPGTGKTLLARAIAKECGCRFLSLSLSSLENKYFGESAKLLAAAFSLARKVEPCILFLDEVDGMIRERSADDQSFVYGFKTELLSRLDGFHKESGAVIVMACTNAAASLDPAVRRRLPRVYTVGLPSAEERAHILAIHAKGEKAIGAETAEWLAGETEGLSGSDLLSLYNLAASARMRERGRSPAFQAAVGALCKRSGGPGPAEVARLNQSLPPIRRKHWEEALRESRAGREVGNFLRGGGGGGGPIGPRGGEGRVERALRAVEELARRPAGAEEGGEGEQKGGGG